MAIPRPIFVAMMHSPPEIILSSHIMKHYAAKINYTSSTLERSMGLIDTLTKIYNELSKRSNLSEMNDELFNWSSVKDDLFTRQMFALLLGEEGYNAGLRLKERERLIFTCKRNGVNCFDIAHVRGPVIMRNPASLHSAIGVSVFAGPTIKVHNNT